MFDIFSASGFLVHTPCGPRKSGIPESVLMPAPVRTATRSAWAIQLATSAIRLPRSEGGKSAVMAYAEPTVEGRNTGTIIAVVVAIVILAAALVAVLPRVFSSSNGNPRPATTVTVTAPRAPTAPSQAPATTAAPRPASSAPATSSSGY